MTDIAAWLSGLGLAEHIPLFARNDIDLSVLPDLGDADLKELGLSLGHRRKLLRALVALGRVQEPEEAGRRQLTVLFSDLAGSTALSTQLDPEDLREVIFAYQRAATEAVRTYGGFLAKYMGDGVLVYFGYPRAREDDAERAVRAGLDILAAVGRLSTSSGFVPRVRVGIATGPVVVGDLIGEGLAQERAVVGEAPNLAARLQGLAEPGNLLISQSTRELLGNLFRLADHGRHPLKGFAEPVQAWSVVGVAQVASRFEAKRSTGLTGFFGRADASARLLALKDKSWSGAGQVVVLSGEAGIGKSRLAAWLAERVAADVPVRFSFQCSAYHTNSALHPVSQQLRYAGGIDPADPPERQLDRLEHHLDLQEGELAEVAPLFASLLSIPTGQRYPPLDIDAAQQRRLLLAALTERLARLAQHHKLFILFEDLHWADATSRELIERAMARLAELPALVVVTTRPGETLSWLDRPNTTLIKLDHLNAEEAGEMVRFLTGGRTLADALVQQITAKTDGVPLFIEELTRSVLESGQLVQDEAGYRLAGSLVELQIPATLQDLLMARLDRIEGLGPVAQVAAAIGRAFTAEMIAAVSDLDEEAVAAVLDKLVEADLIRPSRPNGHARYAFKHALIQDAAYEGLLRSKRQALHAKIVEVVEARFPELVELEEDVLAQHCAKAQLTLKAVDYWLRAGRRSLQRFHLAETATRLQAALKLLLSLPESVERDKLELACQSMLARALIAAKGFGFADGMAAWLRAQALAQAVGTVGQRFAIDFGLWQGQYSHGDLPASKALAARCLADATALDDRTQLCVAERMVGLTLLAAGDFQPAARHLERSAKFYDLNIHLALASEFSIDLLVAARGGESIALWHLGYPDRATGVIEQITTHARATNHVPSLAYTYAFAAQLAIASRNDTMLAHAAETVITFAQKQGTSMWAAAAHVARGWLRARTGGGGGAVDEIASARDGLMRTGTRVHDGLWLALLGEAQAVSGDPSTALATLDRGIAYSETSGFGFWLAELYRLKGTISHRLGSDPAAAEAALERAIEVARLQHSLSWELRATMDLARLRVERGERDAARQLVAAVYERFQEGFETPDLQSAQAMMLKLKSD
jgi:class 3 adenylate cyclase/tetratricopeptide (TPR) repeat protein